MIANCQEAFVVCADIVRYSGFVANFSKSLWEPTQLLVWSGLNWDLVSGSISITDRLLLS